MKIPLVYPKVAWAIHNLIAHPMMEICSWVGLWRFGNKFHDMTVPDPYLANKKA